MKNGWTGGQYSALRCLVGLLIAWELLALVREIDTPLAAGRDGLLADPSAFLPTQALRGVLVLGIVLALLFAIDLRGRIAAAGLGTLLVLLLAPGPLAIGPAPLAVALLLGLHLVLPPRPWGSWGARGRTDPGSGWAIPESVFGAVWVLVGVGYLLRGSSLAARLLGSPLLDAIEGPFGRPGPWRAWLVGLPPGAWTVAAAGAAAAAWLAFLPAAALPRLRPWAWTAVALVLVVEISAFDSPLLDPGPLALHLLLADPAWIRPRPRDAPPDRLFYDGHCGLCHRSVRFLLAEDPGGSAFRFAPLQGPTFREALPASRRDALPDSVVVLTADGRTLVRSEGALRSLRRLGGLWRIAGEAGRVVPRALRDGAYDAVARVRKRIFGTPAEVCPLLPPDLRRRFDP